MKQKLGQKKLLDRINRKKREVWGLEIGGMSEEKKN